MELISTSAVEEEEQETETNVENPIQVIKISSRGAAAALQKIKTQVTHTQRQHHHHRHLPPSFSSRWYVHSFTATRWNYEWNETRERCTYTEEKERRLRFSDSMRTSWLAIVKTVEIFTQQTKKEVVQYSQMVSRVLRRRFSRNIQWILGNQ